MQTSNQNTWQKIWQADKIILFTLGLNLSLLKRKALLFFKVQKALIFLILMVKNIWTALEDSGASI